MRNCVENEESDGEEYDRADECQQDEEGDHGQHLFEVPVHLDLKDRSADDCEVGVVCSQVYGRGRHFCCRLGWIFYCTAVADFSPTQ